MLTPARDGSSQMVLQQTIFANPHATVTFIIIAMACSATGAVHFQCLFSRKPIVKPTHIVLTHARDGLCQMVMLRKTYANPHATLTFRAIATAC